MISRICASSSEAMQQAEKITRSNEPSLEQLHFNAQICIISCSLCVRACVRACVRVCVLLYSSGYYHEPSLLERKVNINFFFSAQFMFTITVQVSSVDNLLKTVQARQNVLQRMRACAVSYQPWLIERKVLYMYFFSAPICY